MHIATNVRLRIVAFLFLTCLFALSPVGPCPSYAHAAEQTIAFMQTTINVDLNNTATIYLTGQSTDAVKWESSNEQVVAVESFTSRKAIVKGTGKGDASIIATSSDGKTSTCKVSVTAPRFSIDDSMTLNVENTDYISVNAGYAISWSSSNNDIVSIVSSGSSSATVRAESMGTAVITAVDKYGTEAKCTVRVRQQSFELALRPEDISDDNDWNFSDTEAKFSHYYFEHTVEGWWDNDYHYHESYLNYETLTAYGTEVLVGEISKCTSENTNIATVSGSYNHYSIYPKGVGTTYITAVDPYGEEVKFKCTVDLQYFIEKETLRAVDGFNTGVQNDWRLKTIKTYAYKNATYGSGLLQGVTFSGARVTATINGKTYSTIANSNGKYSIKTPKYIRIDTPITITTTQYGVTRTHKRLVLNNNPHIRLSTIKPTSKILKVRLKDVHKGDYVKLKVGKKTYKKKIKRDMADITLKFKTAKQKKGQTVSAVVYNKFNQALAAKTEK